MKMLKKHTVRGVLIVLAVAALLVALLVGLFPASAQTGEQQGTEVGVSGTPNVIPGAIFVGDYLRIGVNDGGTLGVGGPGDPGVGLQWAGDTPFYYPSTESLAFSWWGEGYNIAYKEKETLGDNVAYYYPSTGWPPPPGTRIVPLSAVNLINDHQKAIRQVKVRTADGRLQLTFTFTFLRGYPKLVLETQVTNLGLRILRDVVYKRIVDFDVITNYQDIWASTSNEAFARLPEGWPGNGRGQIPPGTLGTVQLTVAGYQEDWRDKLDSLPVYVDLRAMDDLYTRKPGVVTQSFVPITGDYTAGIYYDIGDLGPKDTKIVYTIYQANFPPFKSGAAGD